jgi:hypothetical protein
VCGIKEEIIEMRESGEIEVREGSAPLITIVDHTKAANVYESLYGDEWENHLPPEVKDKVSINRMIDHMYRVGKQHFKGTKWEDKGEDVWVINSEGEVVQISEEDVEETQYWKLNHDALSLSSSEAAKLYMRKIGLWKHLIRPSSLLAQAMGMNLKNSFVPGDHPNNNILDNRLFSDFQVSLGLHHSVTRTCVADDPRKFCMSTPKRIDSAVERIWTWTNDREKEEELMTTGAPKGYRIVQDADNYWDYFITVQNGEGVPDNYTRAAQKGQRNCNGASKKKRGGARTKTKCAYKDIYLHEDALEVLAELQVLAEKKRKTAEEAAEDKTEDNMIQQVMLEAELEYQDVDESDDEGDEVADEVVVNQEGDEDFIVMELY